MSYEQSQATTHKNGNDLESSHYNLCRTDQPISLPVGRADRLLRLVQGWETRIMLYAFVADLIVALHLAYVVFVVGGLIAILIGAWRRRKWIRNPWFRVTHLFAILIVVMECFFKLNCPLTTWEMSARTAAHQSVDGSAFMDRLLTFILIGAAPRWVINGLYFVFGVAIVATFFLVPPRWRPVTVNE